MFFKSIADDFRKLKFLWKHAKPDCRGALLKEFFMDPSAFDVRYVKEWELQRELHAMRVQTHQHQARNFLKWLASPHDEE